MTDTTINSTDNVTEEQVANYLRHNLDFFKKYPDLIAEITLPHNSGQAVSLVEKQVSVLRERNIEMRQRLSDLLDKARENDRLFDKTKRLVLALLEAPTLADFTEALYYSFNNDFKIHYTRLVLFGSNGVNAGPARISSLNQAREHIGKRLKSNKAVTGGIDVREINYLFDEDANNIGSAALTILSHGNLLGVLAIGNQDPSYYRSSMGTLFLGYIGEVITRLLPRHL